MYSIIYVDDVVVLYCRSESFTSAFHMVLYSHCPYFYLCTPNFTALFRAAGVAGEKNPHVLIAPTTRGFREALKNEGNA